MLGEGVGLRLNAMVHDADVPGRSGPENKRWGIAPTVTFGMGTPTEVSLSWQHLQTDNIPDGGVPYLYSSTAAAGLRGGSVVRPTYGNSRDNWYGLTSRDYEKEKSDLFTATVEHKFTDTQKFRNSLRYSKTEQDYLWTQPDDSKGNVVHLFERGIRGHDAVVVGANGQTTVGEAIAAIVAGRSSASVIEAQPSSERSSFLIDHGRAVETYGYDPMNIAEMIARFATEPV